MFFAFPIFASGSLVSRVRSGVIPRCSASGIAWPEAKILFAKYPEIQLFPLPKYAPEYNPTEQVWRWLKPLVHGARTIENGCEEILQRIPRIMAAWINQRLAKLPQIGVGIWQSLLFDYLWRNTYSGWASSVVIFASPWFCSGCAMLPSMSTN